MAIFTRRIANTNDDGAKRGTRAWSVAATYMGTDSYWGDTITGFRFNNVTVPQGATINSAKITIKASGESNYQYYLKIYGIDEDDTADFSSDPTGRTKTTAAIDWDQNGYLDETEYDTSDIGTIVKEIIDRAGWASGNDMGFLILDDGSTYETNPYDYADSTSYCALLTIDYVSGASPSPSGSLSPSGSQSPSASLSQSASTSPSPTYIYDHGIKISKEGYDVKSSSTTQDVFTSKKGVLGKRSVDSFIISTDGDGHGNDLDTHSIGYVPITIVSVTAYDGTVVSVPGTHYSDWGADQVLEEVFNYYVGETTIGFIVYAHHYEPWQGGTDTPLASQEYTMNILYCFNEISTE